jgi:Arc/MetJ-type ribon-helix-helix transcriptional regulator
MSEADRSLASITEKLTVNISPMDLGKIDVLVDQGFYVNRTDFLRMAIRSQIERHSAELSQSIARHSFFMGVVTYNASDLTAWVEEGNPRKLMVIGILHLQRDVTPMLARAAIASLGVRGVFKASDEVKDALEDRMI